MSADDSPFPWRLLADPTRARIVSMILGSADGRQQVGKMAVELGLRQPTVSHHVRALVDAGLLERAPEGRNVWYAVAPKQFDRVAEILPGAGEPVDQDGVLARIVADLTARFAGVLSPETVGRYVEESHDLLAAGAGRVRHLSSLTSQFTADRLTALTTAALPAGSTVPEVLFVCVQNAGRSQLAAAILRHLAGDRVHVRTAGSAPADAVRSVVVTALDEIGVPIGAEFPKPLTDEVVRAADVVITMGCGDACPIYPGRRYVDWDLADPAGRPLAEVRVIRDEIDSRVRELLGSLDQRASDLA